MQYPVSAFYIAAKQTETSLTLLPQFPIYINDDTNIQTLKKNIYYLGLTNATLIVFIHASHFYHTH